MLFVVSEPHASMNASQIGRLCRGLGVAVNIAGLVLLLWNFYDLHQQRMQRPDYHYNTEGDEGMIVAAYLRTLACVGIGCALLWTGSWLGKSRMNHSHEASVY